MKLKITDCTDKDEETEETDPLLALAGTLDIDIAEIKEYLKNTVRPEIRVVKGPYEDHPDPLIALAGTLECNVTDISERHDDYIRDALWQNCGETRMNERLISHLYR